MEAPQARLEFEEFNRQLAFAIAERYEKKVGAGEDFFCKQCGAKVMQTTCFVSLHAREWGNSCAGSGRVVRVALPYCPKCEGEPKRTTTCVHIPMKLVSNLIIITDQGVIHQQSSIHRQSVSY